jgi:predicted permease
LYGLSTFVKSLATISHIDLGIRTESLVVFGVSPGLNRSTPAQSRLLFERLEDELSAEPGVTSVAGSATKLLADNDSSTDVSVQGFQAGPDTDADSIVNGVGSAYLWTLGIPLISGREFTRADAQGTPRVAIVNEQFAKKFNLGRHAVGKRMAVGATGNLDVEIVGLMQNARYSNVKDKVPPLFILPYRQNQNIASMTFYVRTALDPELLFKTIQAVVKQIDPTLPVEGLRTMAAQVRENVFLDRLLTVCSSAFAALATLLAAIGLYGVLAYTVSQRTREMGLRMALGATPGRLRAMVLKQVGWMTLIGGAMGLLTAIAVGHAAESMLFNLKGTDPVVLMSAALALSIVALAAGFIPAHRVSRIDPMRALRCE